MATYKQTVVQMVPSVAQASYRGITTVSMVQRSMLLSADSKDKLRFLVTIAQADGWRPEAVEAAEAA